MAQNSNQRKSIEIDRLKKLRESVSQAYRLSNNEELHISNNKNNVYFNLLQKAIYDVTGIKLSNGTLYKFFFIDNNLSYQIATIEVIEKYINYYQNIEELPKSDTRTIEDFLKIIGKSSSSRFAKIDDLYVPPKEFGEIIDTLSKNKIVFISGSPEYGKTFTAIKILWEWYKKGYQPYWKEVIDEGDRHDIRRDIRKISDKFEPNHIYYFEDPFGKIKYEERGGELELMINEVLNFVHINDNVFIVITSREQIFEEFKLRSLLRSILERLEKKLHVISPSYTPALLFQMLLNYAEFNSCKWLQSQQLKLFLIKELEGKKVLLSPLSIFNFCIYSKNDNKIEDLKKNLIRASEDISRQFAKEIIDMSEDEKLFFSLLLLEEQRVFLFENFKDGKGRNKYSSFKYRDIIWKYKDKIIEVSHKGKLNNYDTEVTWENCALGKCKFLHPSYYMAKKYLADVTFFKNIIRQIILAKTTYTGHNATRIKIIIENYNYLSPDLKSILTKSLYDFDNSYTLAKSILENYTELPLEIKRLLPRAVLGIHGDNTLGPSDRNLFMADLISYYFEMPLNVQKVLMEYAGDWLGENIISNWYYLRQEQRDLIFTIFENNKAGSRTAEKILANYYFLPENIRELVQKVVQKPYSELKEYADRLVNRILFLNEDYELFPFSIVKPILQYILQNDSSFKNLVMRSIEICPDKFIKHLLSIEEISKTVSSYVRYWADLGEISNSDKEGIQNIKTFSKIKKFLSAELVKKVEHRIKVNDSINQLRRN